MVWIQERHGSGPRYDSSVELESYRGGEAMSEPIVSLDKEAVRGELGGLARRTAGDTLSALLEQEAGDLVKADRYEGTAEREAYRAGGHRLQPRREGLRGRRGVEEQAAHLRLPLRLRRRHLP